MNKAIILNWDYSTKEAEFPDGESYELIRDAVGGLIECVTIEHEIDMWINEEGKIYSLDINPVATHLFEEHYPNTDDFIVGNVIFTGGSDDEGVTLGLNDEQHSYLDEILVIARAMEKDQNYIDIG